VTIEADPGGVGKIRGDFDAQGAEVLMRNELLLKLRWGADESLGSESANEISSTWLAIWSRRQQFQPGYYRQVIYG
jgi:hypothetical protein